MTYLQLTDIHPLILLGGGSTNRTHFLLVVAPKTAQQTQLQCIDNECVILLVGCFLYQHIRLLLLGCVPTSRHTHNQQPTNRDI